jgi:hypothetical protein
MKHTLRCHDFCSLDAPFARAPKSMRENGYPVGQNRASPQGIAARIAGAPKRGAGIGVTWSRDPLAGCDGEADQRRVASMPIPCASRGSDPQRGPSSAPRRAPLTGMRPRRRAEDRGIGALTSRSGVTSKHTTLGTRSTLRGTFVARLANIDILAAPRFAPSTILSRNARAFHHYVRGFRSVTAACMSSKGDMARDDA